MRVPHRGHLQPQTPELAATSSMRGVRRHARVRNRMDIATITAVVQITGASKKRRIHPYIIVLKGLPSKQKAQWYL